MTSKERVAQSVDALGRALTAGALPGESDGFDRAAREDAARFVAAAAAERRPDTPAIAIQSTGGEAGRRRMRLVVINDDMPFLVDSIAGAIAARGLTIHRLLHPIVAAEHDPAGRLLAIGRGEPLSIVYVELDRADARTRAALVAEIRAALGDVRSAVRDWPAMRRSMLDDAAALKARDGEAAALLGWLADDHFTLLGQTAMTARGRRRSALGILADGEPALWAGAAAKAVIDHFGGKAGEQRPALLLLKADRVSLVHRRAPLDVVIVRRSGGALSIHVGLWTSAALRSPPAEVPVLRERLARLDRELGFARSSHAAKSLTHALSTLPRDLLISFDDAEVRRLALTAMSLADRPRPKLLLVPGALRRHLFAFVWLPRDDMNIPRRRAIADLLEHSTGAPVSSWSSETSDGELGLLRFTLAIDPATNLPDPQALDAALIALVRGWAPAVEAELVAVVGAGQATRLALSWIAALPHDYRERTAAAEGAADIIAMAALADEQRRSVRLVRAMNEEPERLRLKLYRRGPLVALSESVPVLENFGFRVIEEIPTEVGGAAPGHIHDFLVELPGIELDGLLARSAAIEQAIGAVLAGSDENDAFNQLILFAGLDPRPVVWLRSWFRYLRQTGVAYGLATVVEALRRSPAATAALIERFVAAHDPARDRGRAGRIAAASAELDEALHSVAAIDDDRILRLLGSVIGATLRTNAFTAAGDAALAFKIDSARVPGLPRPVPWREIWVYSVRVEGVHLRGGPVARGGIRWSDRRDDFRTEVLGLMKAQIVKNAVIVPTGAKGGFYPKLLPPAASRDLWLAEGTACYRLFIGALLSITDNIVEDRIVHPARLVIHDDPDPYLVVAADKGTASFSDIANQIALDHDFWLGDAFASGGSNGYDHKAMGITARGAWLSIQRHFGEMGVDIQTEAVHVAGCGDMSGDVFGNGMLLSKSIKLVAAFDHRHIFIDPTPDPAASWAERARLFSLPRSSWDDYDRKLLSAGGGIYPRSMKSIALSKAARGVLGVDSAALDPMSLINAILKSPVELFWFGGIGTYLKASQQTNGEVGDPANDAVRADAIEVRAKVIGEGANLAVTQTARIEFAAGGGRINTDFIDNSAGVDCSDNEVNIKIALNRDLRDGRLSERGRRALLARMTGDVAALVLEDNRLQALALSIAERGGARALPDQVRALELLEASGRLDRRVERIDSSQMLLRRAEDGRGLTRPELAVLLSLSKLALQDAAVKLELAGEPMLDRQLFAAFPVPMRRRHAAAIRGHRLRNEILATKVANRLVNRLGPSVALELTEEEGCSLGQIASAFLVAEQLLDLAPLWRQIEDAPLAEDVRLVLFRIAGQLIRSHIADILRAAGAETRVGALCRLFAPGLRTIGALAGRLIRAEVRSEATIRREQLVALGADDELARRLIRLYELDGVFGLAALAARKRLDGLKLTRAYTHLGEALGLDWAQAQLARFVPTDHWERLLVAGLARELEQIRIEFLGRGRGDDPEALVERWVERHSAAIGRFTRTIASSRSAAKVSAAMLAQITNQARVLLTL